MNNLQPTQNAFASNMVTTWLANTQATASTKNTYNKSVCNFIAFLYASQMSFTKASALAFVDKCVNEGVAPRTINSYLCALRSFGSFLAENGISSGVENLHNVKTKRTFVKQHLTSGQVQEFLQACKASSLRDYALFNLMVRCGLRRIEIARAKVSDITFVSGKRVLMIQGKGRAEKDNFVILSNKAYEPIAEYLRTRKALHKDAPLFVSASNRSCGASLTPTTISIYCKKYMRAIGLDADVYTCHSLRHTTAVQLLKAGASLDKVQDVVRHSSIDTTRIYVESIKKEQRLANNTEALLDDAF